jgi:hypothetical protein
MVIEGCGSFLLVEANEDGAHVVHAILVAAVFGDEFVEELLANGLDGHLFGDTLADPLHHLIVLLHLPYTIAAHNNKIYALGLHLGHVWKGCYHLLIRFSPTLLVLKVTHSPGQVQTTIHTTKTYSSSCLSNTIHLSRVFRLVVFA